MPQTRFQEGFVGLTHPSSARKTVDDIVPSLEFATYAKRGYVIVVTGGLGVGVLLEKLSLPPAATKRNHYRYKSQNTQIRPLARDTLLIHENSPLFR
jgi:hypothetical protein